MVIKSVGPLSCAKIAGTLYVVIGFVIGALISVVSLLGGLAAGDEGSATFGALFGVAAVIALPVLYGCIGFVTTLVMAWLYNVLAGLVGGVELNVQ